MKEQIKLDLVILCFEFLKCITIMYVRGEICRNKYNNMKKLKMQFLKDCGVW